MHFIANLSNLFVNEPSILFIALIGSRASGKATLDSDWDFAIQWDYSMDWFKILGQSERLRNKLANALKVDPDKIDLIDLRRANLAMRASVAEDGIPLSGQDSLAWAHFLIRTWREIENFYWEQAHAD
jgi:predicted nucleotidyltransferase